MDIQKNIEEILQNIEKTRKNFDKWYAKQVEIIHQTKKEAQQVKSDHAMKIKENQDMQNKIIKEINQIKTQEQINLETAKAIQQEQNQIKKEIEIIPKDFDYLENKIFLLKTKKQRLIQEQNKTEEGINSIQDELNAYQVLYGIIFNIEGKGIRITFTESNQQIIISKDENNYYRITEAPPAIAHKKGELENILNQNGDIRSFLASIRSYLF